MSLLKAFLKALLVFVIVAAVVIAMGAALMFLVSCSPWIILGLVCLGVIIGLTYMFWREDNVSRALPR